MNHWPIVVMGGLLALSGCSKEAPTERPLLLEAGMVLVPAGEFTMGSDKRDDKGLAKEFGFVKPLYIDEQPPHRVTLPTFQIDKYEVTNADYKAFVVQSGYKEPLAWIQEGYNVRWEKLEQADVERLRWAAKEYFHLERDVKTMSKEALLAELGKIQQARDHLPVTGVSWYDAYTYCKSRNKRLPTEAEWEKAARGEQGLEYPWGAEWDASKTNTGEGEQAAVVVPVGSVAGDISPYGIHDLAGNVSEWVDDWYEAYPGSAYQDEAYGGIHKVIRGGGAGVGHYAISTFFRGARRGHGDPSAMTTDVGFRCAKG